MPRRPVLTAAQEREIREARFASVAEAQRVVRDASRDLGTFYSRLEPARAREPRAAEPERVLLMPGMPVGELQLRVVLGKERAARAQVIFDQLKRYDHAIDEAGDGQDYRRLDALLTESDVLLAELSDIWEAFEEGEEPISEGWDPWWVELARKYEEHRQSPQSIDEPAAHFRSVLTWDHGLDVSALSDDEVMAMAEEAWQDRLNWLAKLRSARQQKKVPEHVRMLHEIAKLRARKLSPSTREALVPGSSRELQMNASLHPALEAAREGFKRGGFRKAMLFAWAAGLDPREAYLAAKAVST